MCRLNGLSLYQVSGAILGVWESVQGLVVGGAVVVLGVGSW